MDAAILSKLLSPDGRALLGALPPYDERSAMRTSTKLREQGVAPDLAAAALTQSRLRSRARTKFGELAGQMLFTADGLEQATRLRVASLHADRFTDAGVTHVADLTSGIGADAMAFAGAGLRVLATDIDEVTARIAAWNLRQFPEAEARHADGLALDLGAERADGVYADPARRTRGPGGSRRVFDPRGYEPALDRVFALRDAVPALGVKVGPGIPHEGLPHDAEAQWVSVDNDVVEAGLWFGPLAAGGPGRSALVVRTTVDRDGKEHTRTRVLRASDHPDGVALEAPTGEVGQYLYEPDGAVIRAGLVAHAAVELNGRLVDPTIAYITTDSPAPAPSPDRVAPPGAPPGGAGPAGEPALDLAGPAPIATGYRVLDTLPFGLKRLKGYLRERNVGQLTIKKRGTAVVPEQLRKQLVLTGTEAATIVLTRVAGTQTVLLVEPLRSGT
ncbi:class I SAM-dependent methyltransferase [Myceligenerans salitolerans]|uniref:Class I SAM-dependent methyltransferase n=1 Tax=Myceligenerans salitolerans TaxID=1230528 RepID=A0ABS3I6P9_9MICO|nr:class I SAM-dependent methyltransferase [Myceligenerans salitolerans]MBO0608634.1 class I SAM-dependent methyltransferase [Myceligenerans salitolerans]